jgi:hypothetical protein
MKWRKWNRKRWILVLFCCFFASPAFAQTANFQLSLTPDIAIHSRAARINGISLGIWTENPQSAVTPGIVNGSTGPAPACPSGFWRTNAENYSGAHLAFVNYSSGRFTGLQWGAFNHATRLRGLQLGFVNFTDTTDKRIQVGLVNIMNENQRWFSGLPNEVAPVMVLVNWRY